MLFHEQDMLTVYCGDVVEALTHIEPGTVDSVVTSPPYAMQRASTYGGVPESEFPAWTVSWMEALRPALTERGSVMLNISPHVKGGMLADYVLRMRLALRAAGWFEHDELVWVKPDKLPHGRPDVPVRSWESIFWYSRTKSQWSDARRNGNYITDERKASSLKAASPFRGRDVRLGWGHLALGSETMTHEKSRCKNFLHLAVRNIPNEWDHPAPFPVKLADWLVKINTPDGGTVLDPFAGSGTTAVAAASNGFKSIAIDRDPTYAQMIVDRYNTVQPAAQPVVVEDEWELPFTNMEGA